MTDHGFSIRDALRALVARGGSDLHVKVPSPPVVRVHGELAALDGPRLSPADTEAALDALLGDPAKRDEFERIGEVDFAYAIDGVGRFRINAFRQRASVSLVCRAVPLQVRTLEDLRMPRAVVDLAQEPRGIVLVTGTTGSGKSTTLAAMVDHINASAARHIITIEDPIEFLHQDKRSIVNQREVGSDIGSFSGALRRVLRQDPDVILIGEMRDEDTVRTALSAAETGHLVLSTLHTVDATETVNRIIDFFPAHQSTQARAMLAGTLKGVISQRLVPTHDGQGRVAACEILVATGRVHDFLLDETRTGRLPEVIADGAYYGMQTFDQALLALVDESRISMETALRAATNPHDFKLLAAAGGHLGTSMQDVADAQRAERRATRPAVGT
jgi:twitching motility protein PilT